MNSHRYRYLNAQIVQLLEERMTLVSGRLLKMTGGRVLDNSWTRDFRPRRKSSCRSWLQRRWSIPLRYLKIHAPESVKRLKVITKYPNLSGLAVIIGLVVDLLMSFGRVLIGVTNFRLDTLTICSFYQWLVYWSSFLQSIWQDSWSWHGLVSVGHQSDEVIPASHSLAMVATWLTHLFGGSAGRSVVQIGATFANFRDVFMLKSSYHRDDRMAGLAVSLTPLLRLFALKP